MITKQVEAALGELTKKMRNTYIRVEEYKDKNPEASVQDALRKFDLKAPYYYEARKQLGLKGLIPNYKPSKFNKSGNPNAPKVNYSKRKYTKRPKMITIEAAPVIPSTMTVFVVQGTPEAMQEFISGWKK